MKVRLTTSLGEILLQLDPEKAPITVENFKNYVTSGHYEGTVFHRVIEDFMIQAGGMDAEMSEKAAQASIKNEANNGLSNELGSISMARTSDPHSASAQFFINTNDNTGLDFRSETNDAWGYCVFGKVIEGMEIVEKIEETSTTSQNGHQDVPVEAIHITKTEVVEEPS